MTRLTLYADGSSRGNPGPAGAGVVILDRNGKVVREISRFLGHATNNEAEYHAFIIALENARELEADAIQIRVDSELLARQVNGYYQVKSAKLKPLYKKAKELLVFFKQVDIQHVGRDLNNRADMLANQASQKRSG
jgi:ribonuclease HI